MLTDHRCNLIKSGSSQITVSESPLGLRTLNHRSHVRRHGEGPRVRDMVQAAAEEALHGLSEPNYVIHLVTVLKKAIEMRLKDSPMPHYRSRVCFDVVTVDVA
ncbi:hypothetical protein KM043_013307 [Ampulex compressa]|nr:hypothetical protein KM043_013307 [Ampulex compressa]